jgi:hypothetical protein
MSATAVLAFTVVFKGLMTFIGESGRNKTHVAIVNAPNHAAAVLVIGRRFVRLEDSSVVSFDLPAGIALGNNEFNDRVPHLSRYVGRRRSRRYGR